MFNSVLHFKQTPYFRGDELVKNSCLIFQNMLYANSGVPRSFFWGGGSTNSVEDREDGDLGVVAP